MARKLLTAGGVLNLVFGLFHIYLGYEIQHLDLAPGYRGLMQALNVGGTLFIFFFAWASLFHQRDLLECRLGRSVLVLTAALYLTRAAEEFILFRFTPGIFAACLLVGGIYAALLFLRPAAAPLSRAAAR